MKYSYFFDNDEFIKAIEPLNVIKNNKVFEGAVGFVMAMGLNYINILNLDSDSHDEVYSFLNKVSKAIIKNKEGYLSLQSNVSDTKTYALSLLDEAIFNKMGYDDPKLLDDETRKMVETKALNYFNHSYTLYHAFNSSNFKNILYKGINPIEASKEIKEISRIDELFKKHKIEMICGWAKLNCENKVSYSDTPKNCYYYANSSPEWFDQFCGHAIGYGAFLDDDQRDAFKNGDYELARSNILTMMEKTGFSKEEKEEVLDFFERKWDKYANKEMIVASVPVDEKGASLFNEYQIDEHENRSNLFQGISSYYINIANNVDIQTDDIIDIKKATFYQLPKTSEIRDRINKLQNKKSTGMSR